MALVHLNTQFVLSGQLSSQSLEHLGSPSTIRLRVIHTTIMPCTSLDLVAETDAGNSHKHVREAAGESVCLVKMERGSHRVPERVHYEVFYPLPSTCKEVPGSSEHTTCNPSRLATLRTCYLIWSRRRCQSDFVKKWLLRYHGMVMRAPLVQRPNARQIK
jgi:hypothetical protein